MTGRKYSMPESGKEMDLKQNLLVNLGIILSRYGREIFVKTSREL